MWPKLSLGERDARWWRARAAMSRDGLDVLVVWGYSARQDSKSADLRYLTQIGGNGEIAYGLFPLRGEPRCIVQHTTMVPWWLEAQDWVKDLRIRAGPWAEAIARNLKELGYEKANVGVVGLPGVQDSEGWIPYHTFSELKRLLPYATLTSATPLLERLRMIKSEEEIWCLERAAQLSDLAIEALVETAIPGKTEYEVYASMVEVMLRNGGEHSTLVLFGGGRDPHAHPFLFPSQRMVEHGDVLKTEFHAKYAGYLAHRERTVFVGEVRDRYRFCFEVGVKIFNDVVSRMRPGTPCEQVADSILTAITDAGLSYIEAGFHGHGLESQEFPTYIAFLPEDAQQVTWKPHRLGPSALEEGMVIGVQIDLVDPVSRAEGRKVGVVLGDTVVVTARGARRLGNNPIGRCLIS